MSDDLVKRLRDAANSGGYDIYGLHCGLEFEAADRIEQLEAALREIEQRHIPDCPSSFWGEPVDWVERQFSDLRRIARAALGEKKDD